MTQALVTRSQLVRAFSALGVTPGQMVMLHASVKSVGWVVGGPNVILDALREVLTPSGTLMMYVGWPDGTQELAEWPPEKQQAYLAECPAFDPVTSRATSEWSVLTELLRTTPGALRSNHPEASMAAVGAQAAWLTASHPLQYGYGAGSPLERVIQARGQVLLLGSPLDSVTLLHFSECVARVPDKRVVHYRAPILVEGKRTWVDVEEFDTTPGLVDWPGGDYFPVITQAFLDAGLGRTGTVGSATTHLLDAQALHTFGVAWMEQHLV